MSITFSLAVFPCIVSASPACAVNSMAVFIAVETTLESLLRNHLPLVNISCPDSFHIAVLDSRLDAVFTASTVDGDVFFIMKISRSIHHKAPTHLARSVPKCGSHSADISSSSAGVYSIGFVLGCS
jgi:hypothetical protein